MAHFKPVSQNGFGSRVILDPVSRYRRKGAYCSGPLSTRSALTDHRLDDEPSSASLAVASPSPSIAARQPRSAQSCCAIPPAATRRVEVVVLAVISILLFALSFRMFTGLIRRPQAMCPQSMWLACARKPHKTRFTAFAHCAQGPTPGCWHHSLTWGRVLALSVAHHRRADLCVH
jgi:hypothetical protein